MPPRSKAVMNAMAGAADRITRISTSIGVSAPSRFDIRHHASRNLCGEPLLAARAWHGISAGKAPGALGIAPRLSLGRFSNHNSALLAMRLVAVIWGHDAKDGSLHKGQIRRAFFP